MGSRSTTKFSSHRLLFNRSRDIRIIETEEPEQKKTKERGKWHEVHECQLGPEEDVIETFYPGSGICARFRRWYVKGILASPKSPLTGLFLQSHSAIRVEQYRQLTSYPNIVHPFSTVRSAWQIWMVFVFYLSIMEVIMETTFHFTEAMHYFILDTIMDIFCALDIGFNFFCGYYDKYAREVFLKPSMIARNYILGFFIVDFLGVFPFEQFMQLFSVDPILVTSFSLLPLLKLFRLRTLFIYFKHLALFYDLPEMWVVSLKFVIMATVYIQWVSCGHYLVADVVQYRFVNSRSTHSWIYERGLVNSSAWTKYWFSLFRGISSSFSIGLGAGAPETTEDIYFSCFAMLSGQIFLMVLIAVMYQLKSVGTASKQKYKVMERQLIEFMRYNRLPDPLQKRLLQYYAFRFRKRYFREQEILGTLTGQLGEEIVLFTCRRLVENVEFFRDLPIELIVRIVSRLKSEIFLPNDVVVQAGSSGDFMYFIASGTVAVYASDGMELAHLEEGGHFGEIALVMEEKRVASVVAVVTCELYRLDRIDFQNALSPYPEFLEGIEDIAYQRFHDTQEHKRASSRSPSSFYGSSRRSSVMSKSSPRSSLFRASTRKSLSEEGTDRKKESH